MKNYATIFTACIFTLIQSCACDETGFEENEAGIIEVQEELSACVCRVDGNIENPGDGRTWDTACRTVDECAERFDVDEVVTKGCEIWVKKGTIVDGFAMDSSEPKTISIAKNIKAYGGFEGTEFFRSERIINTSSRMSQNRQISGIEETDVRMLGHFRFQELQSIEFPQPGLLSLEGCAECDGGLFHVPEGHAYIDDGSLYVKRSDNNAYVIADSLADNAGLLLRENGDAKFMLYHYEDGNDFRIHNYIAGEVAFCADHQGNVGIGTSNPGAALHVVDTGNAAIRIQSDTNDKAALQFYNNTTGKWRIFNNGDSSDKFELEWLPSGKTLLSVTKGSPELLKFDGKIEAEEIEVKALTADFVFAPEYDLPSLECVEEYISLNGHLPEIPSAAEMESEGVKLGEMAGLLLQKVEELTLYTIEQKKEIEALKREVRILKGNHGGPSSH